MVGLTEHVEHRAAHHGVAVEHGVEPVGREAVPSSCAREKSAMRAKALSAMVKSMPSAVSRRASQLWPFQ
jgi:hypothetical protein